jgi:hypothetical protein
MTPFEDLMARTDILRDLVVQYCGEVPWANRYVHAFVFGDNSGRRLQTFDLRHEGAWHAVCKVYGKVLRPSQEAQDHISLTYALLGGQDTGGFNLTVGGNHDTTR